MKPIVRWMLIILSGSIGLGMLAVMGSGLWAVWSGPNPNFASLIITGFLGLLFAGPCLVIAASLLWREDPEAVELMALMIAVVSFFVCGDLVSVFRVKQWPRLEDGHSWETAKMVVGFVVSLLPFVVPVAVYRLCRKLGSRYLLNRPTPGTTCPTV